MEIVIPDKPFWISYTRLSYEDAAIAGVGIADQHRANLAAIVGTGEPVVHLSDAGGHRSGTSDKQRPAWRDCLRILHAKHNCRGIIATFQDRISRDMEDTAKLIKTCEGNGKHIILPAEGVNTLLSGWDEDVKGMMYMRAIFAQRYAKDVGKKIKRRVVQFNDALIPWGKPPFGQVRDGRGLFARIVGNTDTPAAIRCLKIYAGGMSYDEAFVKLNDEGVPFRDRAGVPSRWSRESVRTVVGNVLSYAGYFIPGTTWDAKAARIAIEGEGNWLEQYVRAVGAKRSPAVDALIDDDLASQVIERRFKNQNVGRKSPNWIPLMSPVLYHAGRKMRAQTRPYGNFYQSNGSGIQIPADVIEDKTLQIIGGFQFPLHMRSVIRKRCMERVSDERITTLKNRGLEIQAKQKVLVGLLLEDRIERADYNQRFDALNVELGRIRAELAQPTEVEDALNKLTMLGSVMHTLTRRERRDALRSMIDAIHLDGQGEFIRWDFAPWARIAMEQVAATIKNEPPQSENYDDSNHAEGGSGGQSLSCPDAVFTALVLAGLVNSTKPVQTSLGI